METSDKQQKADETKKLACESLGISLIPIPFWWNARPDSLYATVIHYRYFIVLGDFSDLI